jgi:8-oxo-dGTP pyrophosphatase MutT (NUDIX family)
VSNEAQYTPVVARPAATVVIVRSRDSRSGAMEVLMLERSSRADFVPGMFVFPGGGVELEDLTPEAQRLAPGLPPAEAYRRVPDAGTPALALGNFIAAIRETFEEAEVLLGRTASGAPAHPNPSELEAGRTACRAGARGFGDWVAAQGWTLAAEDLIYFAHWITPKAVPKRFDTRFFLAEAPPGAQVRTDQAEIVGHRWATPEEAVAAHSAGRMPMIEPTLHNLLLLKEFASPTQARHALVHRPVRMVMPQLAVLPDGRRKVVLPWDPAYVPDPEPA